MEGSSSVHGPLPESSAPLERKLNDHIYQLYEAKGEPTLEILFFHGLQVGHGADAYRSTWTSGHGFSQQVWPATWLAEQFPNSHIFSMSYGSRLDLHNLAENLMHAITWRPGIGQGCPVILVGHSFGGLVIKALCVKADQTYSRDPEANKKIGRFLHNTVGFFFYATPHQGIHSVGKLGAYLMDSPNDGSLLDYVKLLSANSARLHNNFCQVRQKYKVWHIASAGESRPTSWGHCNELVVPEASARYGDQFTMIEEDHISICKPSTKTSNNFQHLINFITMAMLTLEDQHPVTSEIRRPFSTHIPRAKEKLVQSLCKDNNPSLQEFCAWALRNLSCGDYETQLKIVRFPQALEKLVQYLSKDSNPGLQENAARAFRNLTLRNDEIRWKMVNFTGELEKLVEALAKDNNSNLQEHVAWAFRNLALGNDEIRWKIVNFPGALEKLVECLAKDNNSNLQEHVAWAFRNLALGNNEIRWKIVNFPRALEKLVECLAKDNNPDLQEHVAWAFRNLALGNDEITKVEDNELPRGIGEFGGIFAQR